MSEQIKLRKRDADPIASVLSDLDGKAAIPAMTPNQRVHWSELDSPSIQDSLVYADDPSRIAKNRNLGYHMETDVINNLRTKEDSKDITCSPSEHVSGFSGRKMVVMVCQKERYQQRYEEARKSREASWIRTDEHGKQTGFVPYNGHSMSPPRGTRVEIEHEDF